MPCLSVRASVCVQKETLLTRYLAEYLTHFYQTYISDATWDRDERFTIWDEKVKGQGHGGIKYAGNIKVNPFEFLDELFMPKLEYLGYPSVKIS